MSTFKMISCKKTFKENAFESKNIVADSESRLYR